MMLRKTNMYSQDVETVRFAMEMITTIRERLNDIDNHIVKEVVNDLFSINNKLRMVSARGIVCGCPPEEKM